MKNIFEYFARQLQKVLSNRELLQKWIHANLRKRNLNTESNILYYIHFLSSQIVAHYRQIYSNRWKFRQIDTKEKSIAFFAFEKILHV